MYYVLQVQLKLYYQAFLAKGIRIGNRPKSYAEIGLGIDHIGYLSQRNPRICQSRKYEVLYIDARVHDSYYRDFVCGVLDTEVVDQQSTFIRPGSRGRGVLPG